MSRRPAIKKKKLHVFMTDLPRTSFRHTFMGRRFRCTEFSKCVDEKGRKVQLLGCTATNKNHAPEIWLHAGMGERQGLEVVIHEALHACFDRMGESAVTRAGRDIGRLLWRLGFRQEARMAKKKGSKKSKRPKAKKPTKRKGRRGY